ncbi:hypothetical protein [Herminiimonas fonticola]|uniref:Uncharacterized protein n=1 Tax=Herminiimonas fonticola TaxID=303380 RepID=A0A4R6GHM2_9BURK|nr:hypothetical protein [Herminiimonas fonticola]RBA24746.1 hypothetical protein Hfont_0379 [Herminiimonas fonticola]TDN93860.1 hypothetical protein EV677_0395 [Herminiimonas fonticola]
MKSNSILANARNRSTIGFALSLLFHIAILLFALEHRSTPPQELGTSMTAPLSIRLLPPSDSSSKSPPSPSITVTPQAQKMTGKPKEKARKDQDVARKKPLPVPQEKVVTVKPQQAQPEAAPTDMMSMLNNARERRRAAGTPDRNDRENEEQPDDNAIARANVQHSMQHAQSRGRNDGGGVFQVTFKGVRTAEMIFRGWDERRRNDTRQLLEIDAGLNGDIDTAIVRKMIELIRQRQSGDFSWQSRRLGRVVMLSARVQDNAELEDFLKKDFFEYYR